MSRECLNNLSNVNCLGTLTLKRSQIADFDLFAESLSRHDFEISISSGVVRLFVVHLASKETFTLGFFSSEIVYVPAARYEGLEFKYEAISTSVLSIDRIEGFHATERLRRFNSHMLLMNWSLALSIIACSKSTEQKIERLIVTLTFRFGVRNANGYCLPFTVSHQRQSEILGCTRSTVTRYMLSLRRSGMIEVQGYDKAWIVSETLMSKHEIFVEALFAQA